MSTNALMSRCLHRGRSRSSGPEKALRGVPPFVQMPNQREGAITLTLLRSAAVF
jgi:hypothetical protein